LVNGRSDGHKSMRVQGRWGALMVLWGCFAAHKPPKALITKVISPRDLRQPAVGCLPDLFPVCLLQVLFSVGKSLVLGIYGGNSFSKYFYFPCMVHNLLWNCN
jgi:hypothetical protein